MIETTGDLFQQIADAICITTNATIKKNGCAVMGAGCAKTARDRFTDIDEILAEHLQRNGNVVGILTNGKHPFVAPWKIYSFPTKHNWWDDSDLDLIIRSAQQLVSISGNKEKIIIPRPGCHNGRLKWTNVKKVLEPILNDDRFVIIDY